MGQTDGRRSDDGSVPSGSASGENPGALRLRKGPGREGTQRVRPLHVSVAGGHHNMGTILLIILILLLIGGLPTWPHSRRWGYGPSGIVGLLVVVLLLLLVFERAPFGW